MWMSPQQPHQQHLGTCYPCFASPLTACAEPSVLGRLPPPFHRTPAEIHRHSLQVGTRAPSRTARLHPKKARPPIHLLRTANCFTSAASHVHRGHVGRSSRLISALRRLSRSVLVFFAVAIVFFPGEAEELRSPPSREFGRQIPAGNATINHDSRRHHETEVPERTCKRTPTTRHAENSSSLNETRRREDPANLPRRIAAIRRRKRENLRCSCSVRAKLVCVNLEQTGDLVPSRRPL